MSETATVSKNNMESVMSWLTDVKTPAPDDAVLAQQADTIVTSMLVADPGKPETLKVDKQAIQNLGSELQREAARRSAMLKQPVKKLQENVQEGAPVANALLDLKLKVDELDPGQFDFEAGWASRAFGFLPFVGKPMQKYFSRYESSTTQIDAIVRSLRIGREQLERDNLILADDQDAMRAVAEKIQKAVTLGQKIDLKLSSMLDREIGAEDPRRQVIENEWLFPLRQRIQDLQQQLIVNQQGIMSLDLVIRNNNELVRGVDRATNVTVSALQVAVTLALALANQRITLEKVNAVNETTDKLIGQTAKALKEQGAAIHKMASSSTLNIENLKTAFADIKSALDDVANYRQQALPRMAEAIIELDRISQEAGRSIDTMDNARKIAEVVNKQLGEQ